MSIVLRTYLLFFSLLIFSNYLVAQNLIHGRVYDQEGKTLAGAIVQVKEKPEVVTTDSLGRFSTSALPAGLYTLQVSFMGCTNQSRRVSLQESTEYVEVHLQSSPYQLNEITIQEMNLSENASPSFGSSVEVSANYLQRYDQGSLMQSLSRLGGVQSQSIGSGTSKPMIRGLGSNRLVVTENGVKHESQQWGMDHGLEMDQYSADKIRVIRGPSSLKYGSDALAGIIEVQSFSPVLNQGFRGKLNAHTHSNSGRLGSHLTLSWSDSTYHVEMKAGGSRYGDYTVPGDSVDIYTFRIPLDKGRLRNTAGRDHSLSFAFYRKGEQADQRLQLSYYFQQAGFFANAHGIEPRTVDYSLHDRSNWDILLPQFWVKHYKLHYMNDRKIGSWNLKQSFAYQFNYRVELSEYTQHGFMPASLPDSLSYWSELDRSFKKHTYHYQLITDYQRRNRWKFEQGVAFEGQHNRIGGRSFLLPNFNQLSGGIFSIARYQLSSYQNISGGLRIDAMQLESEQHSDWFATPLINDFESEPVYLVRSNELKKTFINYAWSISYEWETVDRAISIHLGRSFRNPMAKELAANGVNYHYFSYEIGNPDLGQEIVYQGDVNLRWSNTFIELQINPFLGYFENYLFLDPTSEYDQLYGQGNQVFRYSEAAVLRTGGEVSLLSRFSSNWMLGNTTEYLFTEQLSGTKIGYPLPFSPPLSSLWSLSYEMDYRQERAIRFELDYQLVAAQTRIVAPEFITPSYQLLGFRAQADFSLFGQEFTSSLQIRNLLNTRYWNHTSLYRLMNLPEMGRNIQISLQYFF